MSSASPQGAETGQRGCSRQMGKNFKCSLTAGVEPTPLPSTQPQPCYHLPASRLPFFWVLGSLHHCPRTDSGRTSNFQT